MREPSGNRTFVVGLRVNEDGEMQFAMVAAFSRFGWPLTRVPRPFARFGSPNWTG